MYEFGVGALFAVQADGSSVEFGTLQDCTFGFSFDKKELYGRKQLPVKVARGKGKLEGKATYADIKAAAINLVLNGTQTNGQLKVAEPVNATVPAVSPYTLSMGVLPGILGKILTVYNTSGSTKIPMTRVSGTPSATNQYEVSATSAVAGSRIYTVTTNFIANDTITIGGVAFTAVASSATGNEFLVGTDIAASIVNLAAVLATNSTISGLYTITHNATTFTLTETIVGGGNTPSTAVVVGTGVVTSGTAVTSVPSNTSLIFFSGDTGDAIQYQYDYTVSTGKTITITNNMMGTAPTFEIEMYATLDDKKITLVLVQCTTEKLDMNFKNEDFMIPDFSFSAFSNASDIVGYLYLDE